MLNSTNMNMLYKKLNLTNFTIALLALLIFTQASIFSTPIIFAMMILLLIVSIYFYTSSPSISKRLSLFILFFITPSIISLFSLPLSYYFEGTKFDYEELNIFGRLANIVVISTVIIFIDQYTSLRDQGLLFRWYKIGLIILMFSALWHALSIYTSFIEFPFNTRSHVHSGGHDINLLGRVTGFAREPSYFVMFVVDFIILSLIFDSKIKKTLLISMAIVLMVLSLSPSGYITLVGAFCGAYFFTMLKFMKNISMKQIVVLIFILIISICGIIVLLDLGFLEYIILRITDLRLDNSSRFFMNVMPFVWASDSNIFSFLFGHGIKTYSIIGTEYLLPSGMPVHVTSNNFYVDTFWEAGLIGFLVLISFFAYLFNKIFKSRFSKNQIFIMFFIFFDLFFSGFFRADFASMRYFIMLYLLFVLLNNDLKILKGKI